MRRVLVTGASGFIGSAAVPQVQAAGFEVHAVVQHSHDGPPGATVHRCDLTDPSAVTRLCADVRATDLLHLAWCTQRSDYRDSAENLTWCAASLLLLEAFARHGGTRVLATGTGAEYGPREGVLSEDLPSAPAGMYATAKASFGALALAHGEATGIAMTWARIFQAYGRGEASHKVVRAIATRLLRGEPVPTTDGAQVRDFIHVRDVATALVTLLCAPIHGIVNVGSGRGLSVRDVLAAIGEATGRGSLLCYGEISRPPGDPATQVADVSKLARAGWQPAVAFADGLAEEVQWCTSLAEARAG